MVAFNILTFQRSQSVFSHTCYCTGQRLRLRLAGCATSTCSNQTATISKRGRYVLKLKLLALRRILRRQRLRNILASFATIKSSAPSPKRWWSCLLRTLQVRPNAIKHLLSRNLRVHRCGKGVREGGGVMLNAGYLVECNTKPVQNLK